MSPGRPEGFVRCRTRHGPRPARVAVPRGRGSAGSAGWTSLAAVLLLAACVTPPPEAPPPPAPTVSPPARTGAGPDTGLRRFEQQQLDRAERAARSSRLAESALAWEILTLLQPRHEAYQQRLAQTRQAIEKEVALRLGHAAAAQQRGDVAAAERAWLEALSLDPRNASAAQSLRDLERERNRASAVGRFATPPGLASRNGSPTATAAAGSSRGPERSPAQPGERNVVEHATMLAGQGELDAAIGLVIEQYGSSPNDTSARLLLANLLVQRADRRSGRDNAAAAADLEHALALNPRLDQARARLRQLRPSSK